MLMGLTNQTKASFVHRDKDGNLVEFRTVVEIIKNYESSIDAQRLMR